MKIRMDPMIKLRSEAITQINAAFTQTFVTHREMAHRRKAEIATTIVAGGSMPPEFAEEAQMRGLASIEFAQLILSKSLRQDPSERLDARELERQKLLFAVAAATGPGQIKDILGDLFASFSK